MKMIGSFFLDIIETLVVALSIFLIVYLFVMQPHQVNGQSMHPNFIDGEYLLTDKITYRFRQPERGEVVVFHAPEATQCPEGTGCDFIKRVIGLPGETIYVNDNKLFVDGEALEEPYIPEDYVTRAGAYTLNGPITIGDNSYFVVGDNRSHSSDSRAWGPVQVEQIVGKVFFRYWPPQEIGTVAEVAY